MIKSILVALLAAMLLLSTAAVANTQAESKTIDMAKEIVIPGMHSKIKGSDLSKNTVLKIDKFKLPGKKWFGEEIKEIIHNQKLIDENNHDQALSITCSNGDCEYQLVKLGNITTQPIQVLTYNYSLEQAYAWIADPTYKQYWNMGTYMQVPNAPPNPGTGYPFSAYFGSLIGQNE